jgi:hypothetical protein
MPLGGAGGRRVCLELRLGYISFVSSLLPLSLFAAFQQFATSTRKKQIRNTKMKFTSLALPLLLSAILAAAQSSLNVFVPISPNLNSKLINVWVKGSSDFLLLPLLHPLHRPRRLHLSSFRPRIRAIYMG